MMKWFKTLKRTKKKLRTQLLGRIKELQKKSTTTTLLHSHTTKILLSIDL